MELESYRNMALASCGFSFRQSCWNSEAGTGKAVVGVAETSKERKQVNTLYNITKKR